MAIANILCFRLLLCTYKSNTVCGSALLKAHWKGRLDIGSGKDEPHHKCPKILVSVTFLVCHCVSIAGRILLFLYD